MSVPAFTAEHSLYESTVVYRNSITATVNVVSPQFPVSDCTLCKTACVAFAAFSGYMCANVAAYCAGVAPIAFGALTVSCETVLAMTCGAAAAEMMVCFDVCNKTACPPPVPTPQPGCKIEKFGGWHPPGAKECGGCCYMETCPPNPARVVSCQCGCT